MTPQVVKRVLFLCTHNSCRSQMAEGWLNKLGVERCETNHNGRATCSDAWWISKLSEHKFEAESAGMEPTFVHPLAVKAMAEAGVDISSQRSKSIDEFPDQSFDYVITLCGGAQKTCPVFPGEYQSLHWDIPDPAAAEGSDEEKMSAFRSVRDDIRARVENLIREISNSSSCH